MLLSAIQVVAYINSWFFFIVKEYAIGGGGVSFLKT